MKKLIISAFDNTLIDDDLAISLNTMLEIDRVRKAGNLFCISTSRCLGDILYYDKDFSFLDYVISNNGALVYDVNKEKVIFKKSLGVTIIKKIFNNLKNDIYALKMMRRFRLENLDELKEIYELEVICNSKKELDDTLKIIKGLKLKINCFVKELNSIYYIDIVNNEIDKYVGCEKILDKTNIKLKDVICFGYDDSDIRLLKKVGSSVAVKNANDVVRDIAKEKTNSNLDGGVEKYLKKNL